MSSNNNNKTKRMSADEKRQAILYIYHKNKEVYTEKELLSLAAKAGVNPNTILDINQSLVDDNLVDREKIGGSNYYWSFPAKKDRLIQLEYDKTLSEIEHLKTLVQDAEIRLANAKRGREEESEEEEEEEEKEEEVEEEKNGIEEESDYGINKKMMIKKKKTKMNSRAVKMARRAELIIELAKANAELEVLKQNDPLEVLNLEKELKLVTGAAHRWTDNIFSCKDYLVKKRGMMKAEANKYLGITDAFDYPEDKMTKKK